MRQFSTIYKFELKNAIRNKAFIILTVIIVLLVAGVMFFPRVKEMITGDDRPGEASGAVDIDIRTEPVEQTDVMLLKTDPSMDAEQTRSVFESAFGWGYKVELTDSDQKDIEGQIRSGAAECAVVMTGPTAYKYYVGTLSMYDSNTDLIDRALKDTYQMSAMLQSGMSVEQAGQVLSVNIESETVTLGKNQIQSFFYAYIMVFALYIVILLYGNMVTMNVAGEKNSRAMEVLVTSAKPTSMMFGKVLASCTAGLIQLCAIFGSTALFYNLNKDYWGDNLIVSSIFNIPLELLLYMLLFFLLGFLMFAFMFGAVASTVSKMEDVNSAVQPVTFLFIIGFVVVMFSMGGGSVDSLLMKVCSYIPFTSPMAMFTRIAMSTVPWYEIAISVALLAASTVGIGVLAAKIYRMGVLLYGTKPKLGAVIKAALKS